MVEDEDCNDNVFNDNCHYIQMDSIYFTRTKICEKCHVNNQVYMYTEMFKL